MKLERAQIDTEAVASLCMLFGVIILIIAIFYAVKWVRAWGKRRIQESMTQENEQVSHEMSPLNEQAPEVNVAETSL